MKTDYITISGDLRGREEALRAADKFIEYCGITGKNAMHIRLLTEETVSMVHGIMEGFTGSMWLESTEKNGGKVCRICVSARKLADEAQESQFLSVSSSGKNENAKGILGKLREMFRQSLVHNYDGVVMGQDTRLDTMFSMGAVGVSDEAYDYSVPSWTLGSYRSNIGNDSSKYKEEWDELEKSVVAKLADDIKVWLKTDSTEVMIEKIIK